MWVCKLVTIIEVEEEVSGGRGAHGRHRHRFFTSRDLSWCFTLVSSRSVSRLPRQQWPWRQSLRRHRRRCHHHHRCRCHRIHCRRRHILHFHRHHSRHARTDGATPRTLRVSPPSATRTIAPTTASTASTCCLTPKASLPLTRPMRAWRRRTSPPLRRGTSPLRMAASRRARAAATVLPPPSLPQRAPPLPVRFAPGGRRSAWVRL